MKNEKVKHSYSVWRNFDALVCGTVLFVSPAFTIAFTMYAYFILFSVIGLLFILFAKKLYDKNILRTDTFRKATSVIRLVIYSVVIISFSLPFAAAAMPDKMSYPIQKMMFLSHYHDDSVWHKIIPEHLPDKTDALTVKFQYGFGPGTSYIDIFYYTDSGTIMEYKRTAQKYGAEYYAYSPEDELTDETGNYINKDKLTYIMLINQLRNTGTSDDDIQNAEIYIFSASYRHTLAWILNEKTGYFRAYS